MNRGFCMAVQDLMLTWLIILIKAQFKQQNCIFAIFITFCILIGIPLLYLIRKPATMLFKKYIFIAGIILFAFNCKAQDTVKKKNRLTPSVVENYFVLKSNKEIKQGLYQATYRGKIPLASGKYFNNKRVGMWHFYDLNGQLLENFDYDRNALLYEKPDNILTQVHIQYGFDNKITDSDKVTKPIKPGGRIFGYIPYMQIFKLSDDYIGTDTRLFTAVLELLVSPGGRLADFKVHIRSNESERITTFSPELLSNDDRIFLPATINGEPVLSRIFVKCKLTDTGELDVD